jgi:hypothetical protein
MPDSSSPLRDHPIFICGHPKAGTSLLRAVFDSHPQLVVYPEETIFFRRFAPAAEGLDLEAQLALAENQLIHIFRWNREHPDPTQAGFPDRDYSAISYTDVRGAMRLLVQQQHRHLGDILSAAVLAYGQVTGQAGPERRAWVEKSPYNEFFTDMIFDWWPEARCVHILRDPRDNFASYRRKHPNWQAEFFARNWRRSTLAGISNQARYSRQRYLILRYEDLTRAPQEALQQLTSFLGIDWNPSLAAPTRAGEQWSGNSMFDDQFQGISAAPISRWKAELSHSDAAVIEALTSPAFQQAGYAPECRLDPYSRLRCFTWPVRSRWRKKSEG